MIPLRPLPRSATAYLVAMLLAISGCVPSLRRSGAAPVPARRLVLALDGVDYRDIVAARQRGLFAGFREPSRLISTFPSISDIAWHEIFGVLAPRGYQRIYYSNAQNTVVGGTLDAITPIEYEERMDLAFGTRLHHLGAYLMSGTISRREVNVAVGKFFDIDGRPTVYVYNVGPDALQHTRGDLDAYLAHLDRRLVELEREYLARTGRALEVVILSDHGHNHARDARFLPVLDALQAHGYRPSSRLASVNDVAFSVDGVTTGFGVFALPSAVDSVAAVLAALEGVEIVSVHEGADRFRVHAGAATALVERSTSSGTERYRYAPVSGDPLRYRDALASMDSAGVRDGDGWASDSAWLAFTRQLHFPAAPARIARGHTSVTLNPAPILVSLADGHRVGLGMVSIANRMRPLGGTHGALSESNSLGVLMTNFTDTHDDLTTTVRAQFGGFDDLRTPAASTSWARLTSTALVRRDRLSAFVPFPERSAEGDAQVDQPGLGVWISPSDRRWATDSGRVQLEWRAADARNSDVPPIESEAWELQQWTPGPSGALLLPMRETRFAPLSSYRLRVRLIRGGRPGTRVLAGFDARTDASGRLAVY